jgi:hypothetical protein
MTLEMIKRVLSMGDNKGSALRQMLKDLKICKLTNVTDEQAQHWIKRSDYIGIRDNLKD